MGGRKGEGMEKAGRVRGRGSRKGGGRRGERKGHERKEGGGGRREGGVRGKGEALMKRGDWGGGGRRSRWGVGRFKRRTYFWLQRFTVLVQQVNLDTYCCVALLLV